MGCVHVDPPDCRNRTLVLGAVLRGICSRGLYPCGLCSRGLYSCGLLMWPHMLLGTGRWLLMRCSEVYAHVVSAHVVSSMLQEQDVGSLFSVVRLWEQNTGSGQQCAVCSHGVCWCSPVPPIRRAGHWLLAVLWPWSCALMWFCPCIRGRTSVWS